MKHTHFIVAGVTAVLTLAITSIILSSNAQEATTTDVLLTPTEQKEVLNTEASINILVGDALDAVKKLDLSTTTAQEELTNKDLEVLEAAAKREGAEAELATQVAREVNLSTTATLAEKEIANQRVRNTKKKASQAKYVEVQARKKKSDTDNKKEEVRLCNITLPVFPMSEVLDDYAAATNAFGPISDDLLAMVSKRIAKLNTHTVYMDSKDAYEAEKKKNIVDSIMLANKKAEFKVKVNSRVTQLEADVDLMRNKQKAISEQLRIAKNSVITAIDEIQIKGLYRLQEEGSEIKNDLKQVAEEIEEVEKDVVEVTDDEADGTLFIRARVMKDAVKDVEKEGYDLEKDLDRFIRGCNGYKVWEKADKYTAKLQKDIVNTAFKLVKEASKENNISSTEMMEYVNRFYTQLDNFKTAAALAGNISHDSAVGLR